MAIRRIALVTGGARGLGLVIGSQLAAEGCEVHLVDRDEGVLDVAGELATTSGLRVEGHVVDLSDVEQMLTLARKLADVNVLVNNAGVHPKLNGAAIPLEAMSLTGWNEMVAINMTAPFVLCQQLLPNMANQNWGRIVNVSSRAGRTLSPQASVAYSATKAGIIGFSRTLAAEAALVGVTVNCVAPGPVRTPLMAETSEARQRMLASSIPMGRYAEAEEVAAAVCFLASKAAAYITGAVLDVNGGGYMP
jgi:3-oxoacyl-[acyl-carrier protein] reductase